LIDAHQLLLYLYVQGSGAHNSTCQFSLAFSQSIRGDWKSQVWVSVSFSERRLQQ